MSAIHDVHAPVAVESAQAEAYGKPAIPSVLRDESSHHLPVLSMTVICIALLAEFLTANVSTPFILFYVRGLSDLGDNDAASITGIIVSALFVTQFLTSLLWANVSDRYGARFVLSISLFGTSIATAAFGLCTTVKMAIVIRLIHGSFLGSVGVARATVATISDSTNESRAYSIIGFSWSMGGVVGAILGGSLETPVSKFPFLADVQFLQRYPYFLPCFVASLVTLSGSVLSLALSRDGGPRTGAIRLPIDDKEEGKVEEGNRLSSASLEVPRTPLGSAHSSPNRPVYSSALSAGNSVRPVTDQEQLGVFRGRLSSTASMVAEARKGSIAATLYGRMSFAQAGKVSNLDDLEREEPNFAQKFLMANELNAPSLSNLWFQAAISADNENVFEDDALDRSMDREDGSIFEDEESAPAVADRASPYFEDRPSQGVLSEVALPVARRRRSSASRRASVFTRLASAEDGTDREEARLPAIFQNVGLQEPAALIVALPESVEPSALAAAASSDPSTRLQVINESEPLTDISPPPPKSLSLQPTPSAFQLLPWQIIIQFALLAYHTSAHDQVFYSYLVSDYKDGGLGLFPADFAQLIAFMTFAQLFFQFILYPYLGPPRGRLSHLALFRIGCLLYVPAYLTVIDYRNYVPTKSSTYVVVLLGVSTAVRYAAVVFSFTAVSVLLNYSAPPHVIGLANGLAQSFVSAARFLGPLSGGFVWSLSIDGHPQTYYIGFILCSVICALAVLFSFSIK